MSTGEIKGWSTERPLPEHLASRQQHIEELREELLEMGESAKLVDEWLQPHIDALHAEIAALNQTFAPSHVENSNQQ